MRGGRGPLNLIVRPLVRAMHEFRNAFWRWFIVLFVIAIIFVRLGENAGYFDSVGFWYTIYCAAGIALPVAAMVAFFGKGLLWDWWRLRR